MKAQITLLTVVMFTAPQANAKTVCEDFLSTHVTAQSTTGHYSREIQNPKKDALTFALIEEDLIRLKRYNRKTVYQEVQGACVLREVWIKTEKSKTPILFNQFENCAKAKKLARELADLATQKKDLNASIENLDSENPILPSEPNSKDDDFKNGEASSESMASYNQNKIKVLRAAQAKKLTEIEKLEIKAQTEQKLIQKLITSPTLPSSFQPRTACEIYELSLKYSPVSVETAPANTVAPPNIVAPVK